MWLLCKCSTLALNAQHRHHICYRFHVGVCMCCIDVCVCVGVYRFCTGVVQVLICSMQPMLLCDYLRFYKIGMGCKVLVL